MIVVEGPDKEEYDKYFMCTCTTIFVKHWNVKWHPHTIFDVVVV